MRRGVGEVGWQRQTIASRLCQAKETIEFGMGMYTLLYLKLITNKDLLDSTENCAQFTVQPEWEVSLGENRYMYMDD